MAENRTLLEAFAFTLLENEVLEREDIERLVAVYKGQSGAAATARRPSRSRPATEVAAAEGRAAERRARS